MSQRPRRLGRVARLLAWAVLAVVAVWVLFSFVFPWVEDRWYNPTVGTVTQAQSVAAHGVTGPVVGS